eukprot:SRR837773.8781.p4 GENE.SRR837773.8781~~SRR837773.8781.p4  ORF type:complete len:103 (+),score=12.47 SRR837773.8781:144-452(+)
MACWCGKAAERCATAGPWPGAGLMAGPPGATTTICAPELRTEVAAVAAVVKVWAFFPGCGVGAAGAGEAAPPRVTGAHGETGRRDGTAATAPVPGMPTNSGP